MEPRMEPLMELRTVPFNGFMASHKGFTARHSSTQPAELEPSAPQVIVMQPATDKAQRDTRDEKPTQMLLLERRGDHFVRVGESDAEHESRAANKIVEGASHRLSSAPSEHRAIPPAVLIFRDGHREEVRS